MSKAKELLVSTKFYIGVLAISLLGTVSLSVVTNSQSSNAMGAKNIESGISICFQRLTQSFTALMIGEFSSTFLSSKFQNTTEQCFEEVANKFSALVPANQAYKDLVKSFSSDIHWFHSKASRLVTMSQEGGLNLSQSNITSKFEALESAKIELEGVLTSKLQSVIKTQQMSFAGVIIGQILILFSLLGLSLSRRSQRREVQSLEAALLSDVKPDALMLVDKLGTIFNIPNSKQFLSTTFSKLVKEKESLEDALVKVSTEGHERFQIASEEDELVIKPSIEFQKTLNTVLDGLKSKAFSAGVVIDTSLDEDFNVYSNLEGLEQFLYYALNFSIDSASQSNPDVGGKITLTSKALGGVSYCKIKIFGYTFTESDLELINTKASLTESNEKVNMNLILLKELRESANAAIAVKNKLTQESESCEIEIVFERAQAVTAENKVKIVKGSKRDIKRILEQNM